MKVVLFVMALVLMKGCHKDEGLKEVEIKYVAETRGLYYAVQIKNQKFYVMETRNAEPKEVVLNEEEWNSLATSYKSIDLNTFEELVGKTNERDFDKKAFGNLFITKDGKMLQTKGFDHTIPPEEIKSFVDLLLTYSKK